MGSGWGRKRPAAAQDAQVERVLREALRAAAESVEPAGDGLERIRRRLGDPWLVRQVPRIRARYADWLPVVLAMAGAVIIAVAGAVVADVAQHGPSGASLGATGASAGAPVGPGQVSGGGGRPPGLNSAEASAAQLTRVPPGPTQANQPQRRPGGVSSAQVKPSRPAASPAATGHQAGQPSAAVTSCPPSPAGTSSATPAPTSPGVTPSPTPSPAAGTPTVGSSHPACDDGHRRQ